MALRGSFLGKIRQHKEVSKDYVTLGKYSLKVSRIYLGTMLWEALEGSAKRLQTDYDDLYQLHWPARNQPMFGQWQYEPEGGQRGRILF